MKKFLTVSAITIALGLGFGATPQAAQPYATSQAHQSGAEVQQIGFKRFKHRRHLRNRGFNHRRFRHRGFHRDRFRHRGFSDRRYETDKAYKSGNFKKRGHSHKHHSRGVILKRKVITPFGVFYR